MEVNKIYQGNNIETLKTFEDNSIDSIVTDPPYGLGKEPDALEVLQSWITDGYHEIKGKGFMGKEWDAFVPQPNFWRECLRVLKPGGHLLSFAGTRTYDWVVMGLRIAGFEIRDQIAWVYGSGFPKSMDVSKAIDKSMGAEREVIGKDEEWIKRVGKNHNESNTYTDKSFGMVGKNGGNITAPSTDEAKQWQGWGTALKPALEPIVMARKPLGFEIDNINYVYEKLLEKNIEVKKWLSSVNDVEKQKNILYSILINLQVMGEIYVNNANLKEIKFIEKIIQTYIKKDIQNGEAKIQTEQNKSQKTQMKNYVTKYLTTMDENVLVVVKIEKNFLHLTTSMETVQNIDAKQEDILIEIYENKDFLKMDTEYFVGTVMRPLECMDIVHTIKKENTNIKITQISNIFLWDKNVDKKTFSETTVANNVLKHGVGGINIDGCRVELNNEIPPKGSGGAIRHSCTDHNWGFVGNGGNTTNSLGRFPANFIHDGSEEVVKLFPNSDGGHAPSMSKANPFGGNNDTPRDELYYGSGSSARFFYTAKASQTERNWGLDGFEEDVTTDGRTKPIDNAYNRGETKRKNIHPTVKPIDLMRYLVRLVTPKGGICLDPFMGSGTTAVACKMEGFNYVGCELMEEYVKIAEARIDGVVVYDSSIDTKVAIQESQKEKKEQELGIMNIFDFLGDEK